MWPCRRTPTSKCVSDSYFALQAAASLFGAFLHRVTAILVRLSSAAPLERVNLGRYLTNDRMAQMIREQSWVAID